MAGGCALLACGGRASNTGRAVEDGEPLPNLPNPQVPAGQAGHPSVSGSAGGPSAQGGAATASGGAVANVAGSPDGAAASGGAVEIGGSENSQAGAGGDSAEPPPEFPPRGVCGPMVVEYAKRYCPDLDSLSVKLEAIEDRSGDGALSPGEEGRFVFTLVNTTSVAVVSGPCVGVASAIPGFTVLESYNPTPGLYGVLANSSARLKVRFRVESSVAPGTRIPLQAWLDIHSAWCPNGADVSFELPVVP